MCGNKEADESRSLIESDITAMNYRAYRKLSRSVPLITGRHLLLWPTAFLFMAAHSFTYSTFSQYVYIKQERETFPNVTINTTRAYCERDTNTSEYIIQETIQQKAAFKRIYLYFVGGVPAIVATFVFGVCTDRFGRKFLFYLAWFGMTFRTLWAIVGVYTDWPLYYFIPGYIVEGCSGQVFNVVQASYIYISDITIVGMQRSVGIVMIQFAFGLATTFPTLAVGYLLQDTNSFMIPFYISIGLLALALVMILILPETFPKKALCKRIRTSRLASLKESWGLFCSYSNVGKRWMYIVTLSVFVLTTYDFYGRQAIEDLYLLNNPFCWGPEQMGIFNALRTGLQQIASMTLVIVFKVFLSDEGIAILGCVSFGASFILEAWSSTDTMMYVGE